MKTILFALAALSSAALAQTTMPAQPATPSSAPIAAPSSAPVLYQAGQSWKIEMADADGNLKEMGTFALEAAANGAGLRAAAGQAQDNRFFAYLPDSEQVVFGFFKTANGQLGKDAGTFCILPDGAAFQDLTPLEGVYFDGDAAGLKPVLDGSDLEKAGICQATLLK